MNVLNPDYYDLEQAGALGIGNANSLGAIFNLVGLFTTFL